MMKKIISTVVVLSVAPAAFASSMNEPYVGVEALFFNQGFKAGHGKDKFSKNHVDYSVFGGIKFSRHFGVEAGYELQPSKKKDVTFSNADFLDGNTYSGSANATTKIRGSHPYLGLFGEWKCHKMKFQAMVGASVSHINVRAYNITKTGTVPADFGTTFNQIVGSRTKIVPMVKLSGIYDFTHHFGVRVSANYRNLSNMRITIDQNTNQSVKPRDAWGVGLGLVYSF